MPRARKRYPYEGMMTPYEKLKSLPKAERSSSLALIDPHKIHASLAVEMSVSKVWCAWMSSVTLKA